MIPVRSISPPDCLHLSIGENCLTDDILHRHGLKSFSTIYSHGRSNIDYAIHLERDDHRRLLENAYLYYDHVGEERIVRNRHYASCSNIYHSLHKNGFEFTHHDVLSCESARASIARRITRLDNLRGKSRIRFFYHYRINEDLSIDAILEKAEEFLDFYSVNAVCSDMIVFTQTIVNDKKSRGLSVIAKSSRARVFSLRTFKQWGGENQDAFWARNDDDLIALMLRMASMPK